MQRWKCGKCDREIEVLQAVSVICCGRHASLCAKRQFKSKGERGKTRQRETDQQQLSLFSA